MMVRTTRGLWTFIVFRSVWLRYRELGFGFETVDYGDG
jgi:hypothetical protein